MMKIPQAAKICIASQAIAFLIPLIMVVSGHKNQITSQVFGFCVAIAAFSKAIEGITSVRVFNNQVHNYMIL